MLRPSLAVHEEGKALAGFIASVLSSDKTHSLEQETVFPQRGPGCTDERRKLLLSASMDEQQASAFLLHSKNYSLSICDHQVPR